MFCSCFYFPLLVPWGKSCVNKYGLCLTASRTQEGTAPRVLLPSLPPTAVGTKCTEDMAEPRRKARGPDPSVCGPSHPAGDASTNTPDAQLWKAKRIWVWGKHPGLPNPPVPRGGLKCVLRHPFCHCHPAPRDILAPAQQACHTPEVYKTQTRNWATAAGERKFSGVSIQTLLYLRKTNPIIVHRIEKCLLKSLTINAFTALWPDATRKDPRCGTLSLVYGTTATFMENSKVHTSPGRNFPPAWHSHAPSEPRRQEDHVPEREEDRHVRRFQREAARSLPSQLHPQSLPVCVAAAPEEVLSHP